MAAERLPNLIIAGFSKAGTSTLFEILAEHPSVHPSTAKETRFFQTVRYGEPLGDLDSYRAYFRGYQDQPVVMEATPDYVYGGAATATAIKDACDPRILLIMREPIGRLRSFFRFLRARQQLPADMSLDDYVHACLEIPDAEMNLRTRNPYTGVWGGLYANVLPPWLELYGDDCRVVFFDDLVRDPTALFADVARWLDIDPARLPAGPPNRENATVEYRSAVLFRVAARLAKVARPVLHFHPGIARRARRAFARVNETSARPEEISPRLHEQLSDYYRDSNQTVATLLRDRGVSPLPPWLEPSGDPAS